MITQSARAQFTSVDAESVTMMAGSLGLSGQPNWLYYNGSDSPQGAYMGSLYSGANVLTATVKLPKLLDVGRYHIFFYGVDYDTKKTITASLGGATSSTVNLDDRDVNGCWTDGAVIDVATPSDVLEISINRNPLIPDTQKYLFQGLYITANAKETVTRDSVAVKLEYPTIMDNSAPKKGNIIEDGSFETGVDASWGFDGRRTEPPLWDSSQGYDGHSSMKIPLDHGANAYDDNMQFASRIYHLKPNRKYTASMWIKTSPGQTVAVSMYLTNAFTPPQGYPVQPVTANFIYATDTWQRLSVSDYALEYPTSDYNIRIFSNELPGGYLWIDCVQLEEGDLTDYQPATAMTAGVVINNGPGNIFYEDESVSGTLIARNASSVTGTAVFRYEIYDFMNRVVQQGSQNLTLPAQTVQQTPFDLRTGKRGIFRLVSWIDGMENTDREIVYSVIPRPPVAGVDVTSYLGVHPNYTESELTMLQKLGIKWSRVLSPSAFFRWSVIEPVEGQFSWYDAEVLRGTAHGLTTLGTIGTNDCWPSWADHGGLPDLAKWQTFVGQLTAHYSSSVQYWEIWNEPNSIFTPDFYAQMLKSAVDAIEVNSPNSKIVGMGGVTLSYMQAVTAALQARYPSWDWKQHIDVLSTHDYPDGEPPERFISMISTGTPVWNTESGSWDRGFYQGADSSFTAWGKNLWPHADASRYYHGMLGSPTSVLKNFLRSIASGQTKYFYYDSRAAASPAYLRSHTTMLEYDGSVRAKGIAYAIGGYLVDHSIGLGNASTDPNSYLLVFDKTGGPIASLFTADKKPRQITIPLSTSQFQVLDMMGNPTAGSGTTIPYGRIPVYLKGVGITGAALKSALQAGVIESRTDIAPPNISISDAPRGPISEQAFRVRWIAIDDSSYPNLGEISPESTGPSDIPSPNAILYSYRLAGYSDWSAWTPTTYVDFFHIPDGSYTFSVVAKDSAGNQSAVVTRSILIGSGSLSSCSGATPSVSLSPSNASVLAGQNVSYTVSVTNNDATVCPSRSFNIASLTPSTWPTGFSQTSITVAPSSSASISMVKTVPATTPPATYGVDVTATSASSSTIGSGTTTVMPPPTVTPPPTTVTLPTVLPLSIILSVPTTSYSRSSTVSLTARATQGTSRAPGVSVLFTLVQPDGRGVMKTVITDSNGQAVWKYRVGPKDLKGIYTATARGTLGTQTSMSNSINFTVQ